MTIALDVIITLDTITINDTVTLDTVAIDDAIALDAVAIDTVTLYTITLELVNIDDDDDQTINKIRNIEVKHMIIDVESTLVFNSLDVSSLATNRLEFPSKEFGDFMKLLIKWNLLDICDTLNEFLDLYDDLTEEIVINNTEISWYDHAIVASSDYIRAKSMYYNELSFSDVSINKSGEEIREYNIDKDACFGKVLILINVEIQNYSFNLTLIQ
ncbi:14677_t:CDS:2, partial [Funneliformis mosseae]